MDIVGGVDVRKVDNSDVVVIIAVLNEEKGVGPTLRELREVLVGPQFLVVDGNSVDGTVKIVSLFSFG